jgi:hypothetical protein
LNHQYEALDTAKQGKVHVKFVLNDIKANAIAKLLINFAAMRKLGEFDLNDLGKCPKATRAAAVCFCIFIVTVVPPYIDAEIKAIISDLVNNGIKNDDFWSFVKLDEADWLEVKSALETWLTPCPATLPYLMNRAGDSDFDPYVDSVFEKSDVLKEATAKKLQRQIDAISGMNEQMFKETGLDKLMFGMSMEEGKAQIIKMLKMQPDSEIFKMNQNSSKEDDFYKKHRFYPLPKLALEKPELDLLPAEYEKLSSKNNLVCKELASHVRKNWKPNVTMIDYEFKNALHSLGADTQFNISFRYCDIVDHLMSEPIEFIESPISHDSFFNKVTRYFHFVAKAIINLGGKQRLTVKCCVGDLNKVIEQLRLQSEANESAEKFDRIYLSNIPDYTSLLYPFLQSMPMLKLGKQSYVRSNNLLNCGMWKDYGHYVYSGKFITFFLSMGSML